MSETSATFIIAEAGVNHNGSLDQAIALIDVAKQVGADAVKFQTFRADNIVSRHAPKAEYQQKTTAGNESQYDMIRRLELDHDAHIHLFDYCRAQGIQFLSTPFDNQSLDFLVDTLDLPVIKISSGDLSNAPFLLHIAQRRKPVILSTGMSTLADIEQALGVLAFGYCKDEHPENIGVFEQAFASSAGQHQLTRNVSLLHCTTEYPAPFDEVNLKAMDTLVTAFGLPVGFSDHTPGIAMAIAAVARGACIVEKHFTLDRNLPGPDHKASLEPDELRALVQGVRQVEQALGNGLKVASRSEIKNKPVARKSLVALKPIHKGERFSVENLGIKRPGNGMQPIRYWDMLGTTASRDYTADEVIQE